MKKNGILKFARYSIVILGAANILLLIGLFERGNFFEGMTSSHSSANYSSIRNDSADDLIDEEEHLLSTEAESERQQPVGTDVFWSDDDDGGSKGEKSMIDGDLAQDRGGFPVKVAIVIDDIGFDLVAVKRLLTIAQELNFSILPFTPKFEEILPLVKEAGSEIILHLPLESKDEKWGNEKGLLTVDLDDDSLKEKFEEILASFGFIPGFNNHMGSKFMEVEAAVDRLMRVVRTKNIFFLDSKTTALTVGCAVARKYAIPCLVRDLFLDHDLSFEAVNERFDELLSLMDQKEQVIAIGHPHDVTITVLERRWHEISENGGETVRLSKLFSSSALSAAKPSGSKFSEPR